MAGLTDFEFIRMRQKNLMPSYMKEFHEELTNRSRPSIEYMPKHDYIYSWFSIFDEHFANDTFNSERSIRQFSRYNILQLKEAFEWVINHFAELDIGGNMKWYLVTLKILEHIANSTWGTQIEKEIIKAFISDTRWFDY